MDYKLDKVLDFIIAGQNEDGSFSTYELYPVMKPGEDWSVLPDSSPFITANVLYSLLSLENPALKTTIDRGCRFLLSCMEHRGYWRFWPAASRQHAVPLDMDDTCVASHVLERCGHRIDNKNVITSNCDSSGYFYTWLIPALSAFVSHPSTALYFSKACLQALSTRRINYFTYTDKEPAVAANALLYLGESCITLKSVGRLMEDIKKGNFRLQFYHDEIMVYYHVARAYRSGVKTLGGLKDVIGNRLSARLPIEIEKWDELLKLMAAIVLLDYDMDHETARKLVDSVADGALHPGSWKPLPYFSSENRNFMAGSPVFTAAIFAEAAGKLRR